MQLRRITSTLTAIAVAGTAVVATTAPAQAGDPPPEGSRSLAAVLAADGRGFDRTAGDFDILDKAVRAVLAEKPKSKVRVLAKGNVRLTAFAPTDGAFRRLVKDLTGTRYVKERKVFDKLAGVGTDTVESVLLYHVVPGRVTAADVVKLTSAKTAEGRSVAIKVTNGSVFIDGAQVTTPDVEASNGVIHVVDAVLLPPAR